MSRSKRRPYAPTPRTQQGWSRSVNRAYRRIVKQLLRTDAAIELPLFKEVANLWDSPSDGVRPYLGHLGPVCWTKGFYEKLRRK